MPRYWGAWSPGGGCVPEWPRGSGPRVFGYLKPPRPQWELAGFVSFLRAQPMATLIYVPGGDREWLGRFETHSLRFVHEPVDIRQVGRECDAAILNGNAGSVGELLLHGAPLLNIPLHLEQLITAHRVADLGAGRMADARRLQQMAEELLALLKTPSHHTAAKAFAGKYADFDPEQAIEAVAGEICRLV